MVPSSGVKLIAIRLPPTTAVVLLSLTLIKLIHVDVDCRLLDVDIEHFKRSAAGTVTLLRSRSYPLTCPRVWSKVRVLTMGDRLSIRSSYSPSLLSVNECIAESRSGTHRRNPMVNGNRLTWGSRSARSRLTKWSVRLKPRLTTLSAVRRVTRRVRK